MARVGDDPLWWLDELELGPSVSPLRMGVGSLGDQPWLIADSCRDVELALKRELHDEHPEEVFAALEATEDAGEEVAKLLVGEGVNLPSMTVAHPLERAGLGVQEDLCVLHRDSEGWHLVAASLSFPSRWRLSDKIGLPLVEVHGPVEGYAERLASRVNAVIDRLDGRIVRRRNWFVHPDPALFQPTRPPGGDRVVPARQAMEDLWVRSERQTLRRIPGGPWALFTIKIQQSRLRHLAERRSEDLTTYVVGADRGDLAHRGIAHEQRVELLAALDQPTGSR